MILSEAQLEKIASNKKAAEKRRAEKALQIQDHITNVILCEKCDSINIIEMYLSIFNERICKSCAASDDDWELMNKTSVASEYLLPDDCIRHLRHKTKDNPHRKGWAEMKLYLRRHARIESYRRWGGSDALESEKLRRNNSKLERELSRAVNNASNAGGSLKQNLLNNEHDDCGVSETRSILAKMIEQGDVLGAAAKQAGDRYGLNSSSSNTSLLLEGGSDLISSLDYDDSASTSAHSKRQKLQNVYPTYKANQPQADNSPKKGTKTIAKPKVSKLANMLSAIRGSDKASDKGS